MENTQSAWYRNFLDICKIPHGSGNERALSDHIMAFAKKNGLRAVQDEVWNVVVYKPASPGYEQAEPVVLQSHLDMVCEKEMDSPHNFETDPIWVYEQEGFLHATKTTLGADNGIGCAYMLSVLEDASLAHPPIEAVFTTSEEVGMEGMAHLDIAYLQGRRMLNLDSEGEGVLITSCAGGSRYEIKLPLKSESPHPDAKPWLLQIKGLTGGHSGVDINLNRANAILLLGRLLSQMQDLSPQVQVADIHGGSADNSIPRDASAVLWVKSGSMDAVKKAVGVFAEAIRREYDVTEKTISIEMSKASVSGPVFSRDSLKNTLSLILLAPNGVTSFSQHLENTQDASSNLGVVQTGNGYFQATGLLRSNTESKSDDTKSRLRLLADLLGGTLQLHNGYPAWEYNGESALRACCLQIFKTMYSKEMKQESIHGGLECALMRQKCPDMDMVSIGPDMFDAHSTKERADIASVQRLWDYLIKVLAALQ